MSTPHAPPRGYDRTPTGLWFGLLGGAAAWAVQFLAGYLISEGACVAAGEAGLAPAALAIGLISLIAFAVAVAATLAGRRVWLQERRDLGADRVRSEGGSGWTGLAGALLSGVFAFVILVQTMPLFLGGGCA